MEPMPKTAKPKVELEKALHVVETWVEVKDCRPTTEQFFSRNGGNEI
jgi:hypothetical protein